MFMIDHDWILITISKSRFRLNYKLHVQKNPTKQNRVKLLSETTHQYIFKRSIIQPLFFILACICFVSLISECVEIVNQYFADFVASYLCLG